MTDTNPNQAKEKTFRTRKVINKIPIAITIAGSDSVGGAGVQADLKTFAALGVHGATVITSVTAQNTFSIRAIEDLKIEIIREQIRAVSEDLEIDAAKTGMLHTEEIIKAVSSEVSKYDFPLVVDPVMVAKSGKPLLKFEAIQTLIDHLLPKATIITPNRNEAEKLADMKIKNLRDARIAAKKISRTGAKAVVIKGGHLEEKKAVDLLYLEGRFRTFSGPRIHVKTTHGTGCCFSAAIAAELAKKTTIPIAVEKAKEVVSLAIKFGLEVGSGYGPVNPMAHLHRESCKCSVLMNLKKAKTLLETNPKVATLIPEVGMNVAMATPYIRDIEDIAAIDGRIVRTTEGARAAGDIRFGSSSHLARYILEIIKYDETKLAAINLKFSEEILETLENRGMTISFYDRRKEPEETKNVDGMTIHWGVNEAVKNIDDVPDVIYHRGDVGKEPMIIVLGDQALELAKATVKLAREIGKR